jgi:hypothetical protein
VIFTRKFISVLVAFAFLVTHYSAAIAQVSNPSDTSANSEKVELLNKLINALTSTNRDVAGLTTERLKNLTDWASRLRTLLVKKTLTPDEQKEIQTLISDLAPQLQQLIQKYNDTVNALATQGDIPDAIAKQLVAKCGPAYRDVLVLIRQNISKDGATRNTARLRECKALYDELTLQLDLEIATLETNAAKLEEERKDLERQIAEAKTPEERKELGKKLDDTEAKIKENEEKQKKTRKVRQDVNWGNVALGLLIFAVGVVLAVFGDEQDGIALMIAGGTMADDATKPKTKDEEYEEKTKKQVREGVEPKNTPSAEMAADLIKQLESQGLQNITQTSQRGNYVVMVDTADGTWFVYQVQPYLLVVRVASGSVQIRQNPRNLKALVDLKSPRATELRDIDTVIKIRFSGSAPDNTPVTGGIAETAVGSRSYSMTVD